MHSVGKVVLKNIKRLTFYFILGQPYNFLRGLTLIGQLPDEIVRKTFEILQGVGNVAHTLSHTSPPMVDVDIGSTSTSCEEYEEPCITMTWSITSLKILTVVLALSETSVVCSEYNVQQKILVELNSTTFKLGSTQTQQICDFVIQCLK